MPLAEIFTGLKDLELDAKEHQDLARYLQERIAAQSSGGRGGQAPAPFDWKAVLASFKEQMKTVQKSRDLRQAGTVRFVAGDVEGAQALYSQALSVLKEGTVVPTEGTRKCLHSCRLNLAACEIKRADYMAARATLSDILDDAPDRVVRLQCLTKRARVASKLGDQAAEVVSLGQVCLPSVSRRCCGLCSVCLLVWSECMTRGLYSQRLLPRVCPPRRT